MTQHCKRFAWSLCAPEGPTVGPDGWILNVCSFTRDEQWPTRGGDVTATHFDRPGDSRVLFNTSSNEAMGIPAALAFGPDEALYVCDEGRRAVLRVDSNGAIDEFIGTYRGERLNGPNDLSFDPRGNLYFTDPWTSSLSNRVGAVYRYDWEKGRLDQIRGGMAFPNGIVARQGSLYVAETMTRRIYTYETSEGDIASSERLFCELPELETKGWQGPDGMAFDRSGLLHVAALGTSAVLVYDADGELVERIVVPGVRPTNVCFGGDDGSTMLVTIDDTGELVAVDRSTPGQRLEFCPSGSSEHSFTSMMPGQHP